MRRVRTLHWGVLLSFSALLVGCDEGDDAGPASPGDGSGGRAVSQSGGMGGTSDPTPSGAGEGGAGAGASGLDPAARLELCEAICATESALPCALETTECIMGWCLDGVAFPPQCVEHYDTMLGCMAGEPVDSFYCDADWPYPKEETCAGEQATLALCILA